MILTANPVRETSRYASGFLNSDTAVILVTVGLI